MYFKIVLIFFSISIYSQQGYISNHSNTTLKGWSSSNEFSKPDVIAVDYNYLRDVFLNKKITTKEFTKEFREYRYQNFYFDKKLKRSMKDRKSNGWKQISSNGSFGTLVFYRGNSNYQILFGRIFIVKSINPISEISHVAKTDDSNYVFELYNKELGEIYYEYNSKYKDDIEIKIFN
tara:strand:+ start:666 stop:1196 length:531 start_codon:yes stop_codon:yes gene_type:complete